VVKKRDAIVESEFAPRRKQVLHATAGSDALVAAGRPAATSARLVVADDTEDVQICERGGGVGLILASLRALLRQLSRDERHAPSFARG
jgi:hypothetical protein